MKIAFRRNNACNDSGQKVSDFRSRDLTEKYYYAISLYYSTRSIVPADLRAELAGLGQTG
jgi:hypothetical protein